MIRIRILSIALAIQLGCLFSASASAQQGAERARARDLGVAPGILPTGENNAITDVAGVRVGHSTIREGNRVRSGVTAIVPHGGNIFEDKVPAAIFVGNGFGKLMGISQVRELGELETPILLTCTLCVPRAADALIGWVLEANPNARSVNALVGETNDGFLNDIRSRPVGEDQVIAALRTAAGGPVQEGSVGAGTGTIAFGWKGGIGTSSRRLPASLGGYTVGVLVQSNFGGVLQIMGVPVGQEMQQYFLRNELDRGDADGSIMIVVATDAPLDSRNLERLAQRAILGLARTGSPMTNGSGDYVIAFSTAEAVRRSPARRSSVHQVELLPNDRTSPLFQAAVEATEEAILNSLFAATTEHGHQGTIQALPLDRTIEILRRYGIAAGRD
ncbi:P1 family peptidase [soil metagenome]